MATPVDFGGFCRPVVAAQTSADELLGREAIGPLWITAVRFGKRSKQCNWQPCT